MKALEIRRAPNALDPAALGHARELLPILMRQASIVKKTNQFSVLPKIENVTIV